MQHDAETRSESLPLDVGSDVLQLGVLWIFPFDTPVLTAFGRTGLSVGRDTSCGVQLPGQLASRLHARIDRDGPIWLITDTESKNGTHLNGQQTNKGPLVLGHVLRVGDAVGLVVDVSEFDTGASFRELASGLYGGTRFSRALADARVIAATSLSVIFTGC